MSDPMSLSSLLRVAAGLAAVLAVFFLVLRALKTVQGGGSGAASALRVVTAISVSPRERLLLVQVGEQQILLGSGPQGLNCLHVLPQPIAVAGGLEAPPLPDWLRRVVQRTERQNRSP